MQIVFLGDNLYGLSKPIFLQKKKKKNNNKKKQKKKKKKQQKT